MLPSRFWTKVALKLPQTMSRAQASTKVACQSLSTTKNRWSSLSSRQAQPCQDHHYYIWQVWTSSIGSAMATRPSTRSSTPKRIVTNPGMLALVRKRGRKVRKRLQIWTWRISVLRPWWKDPSAKAAKRSLNLKRQLNSTLQSTYRTQRESTPNFAPSSTPRTGCMKILSSYDATLFIP